MVTDVSSVNLEQTMNQRSLDLNKSRVKFEMVNNAPEIKKPKGSFVGKCLKALGFGSNVGWLFPGVGWIAAAGGQGLGAWGANLDAKAQARNTQPQVPTVITTPGFGMANATLDPTMSVVAHAKLDATQSAIGGI